MQREKFSLRKRLKSFIYAFNGLRLLFKEEHNARIHLVAALCAAVLGCFLALSNLEWAALSLVIGAVFAAELINSAIENLADYLAPEKHETVKKVKDMAAAAVLVLAVVAVVVGCLIFLPKIWCLVENGY